MERALCEQDSGVTQIALFDRLLQEQRDGEGQKGSRRGFRGSWSSGKAKRRGLWVFRL